MAKQLVLVFVMLLLAAPMRAAPCGGDFNGFLAAMAGDAQGQGSLPRAVGCGQKCSCDRSHLRARHSR